MDTDAQTYYTAGGTLSVNAPSYIERDADALLLAALLNSEFCYVLDTRQIGKSSLMVRTADKLRKAHVRAEILDLTSGGNSVSVEQWYYGLLVTLAKNTGLPRRLPRLLAGQQRNRAAASVAGSRSNRRFACRQDPARAVH